MSRGNGRPYMQIGYRSKKNTNSTDATLDYIMREKEYSDRQDLYSYKTRNIPTIYHINKENEIYAVKNFFNDFEKYSRVNRRIARTLTFDLPITREGNTLENIESGIYNRIVERFINNIEDYYVISKNEKDKERIYKREDEPNGEPFKIPFAYAIHHLEKEDDKYHPHCHLIIATIGFKENDCTDPNVMPEDLFKKGINNTQLSKLDFYYKIFSLYAEAVNQEIKDLKPEIKEHISKRFRNISDYRILNQEKRDWIEASQHFQNLDDPISSYTEVLTRNMAMKNTTEKIADIEKRINTIKQEQRFLNTLFDSLNDDYYLLKNINKRNELYDKLLEMKETKFYEYDNFSRNIYNEKEYVTFNGYKILDNITNGYEVLDEIKSTVKHNSFVENNIVSTYYNYGSFSDFNKKLEAKTKTLDDTQESINNFINDVDLLTSKYINAVNTYNKVEQFREYIDKDNEQVPFNKRPNVKITVNDDKKENVINKLLEQIAYLDFIIQATLQRRDDLNVFKKLYYNQNLNNAQVKELTLEEYINTNSEITYQYDGMTVVNKLEDARETVKQIETKIKLNEKRLSTSQNMIEANQIRREIIGMTNLKDSITKSILFFTNTKYPNLVKEFYKKGSKKITITDTLLKRYENVIKKYKLGLNAKDLPEPLKVNLNKHFKNIDDKVNNPMSNFRR